jgi:hypothetical protein
MTRSRALARHNAIAAVDGFERARRNGRFMPVERQTLERLRRDERFGEAWQQIEPCFKGDDGRGHLIPSIIYAARVALEAPDVFGKKQSVTKGWKQARQHATALRKFLTEKVKLQNGSHDQLVKLLSWLLETIEVFKLDELDVAQLREAHDLTREYRSPAGQRATFMARLSKRMVEIFGKPLDRPVALITEIVLKTEATVGQVRNARRYGEDPPTTRSARRRTTGVPSHKK